MQPNIFSIKINKVELVIAITITIMTIMIFYTVHMLPSSEIYGEDSMRDLFVVVSGIALGTFGIGLSVISWLKVFIGDNK